MSTKPSNQATYEPLYAIAAEQAGYFTAPQARAVGFSPRQLHYYAQTGRFIRLKRGLYRLALFPASSNEDLFIAWLEVGSRAVISHDTALALYELSDILPGEIHLTIPPTVSRRHKGLRLHTARLSPDEVARYTGLPVTTVSRTIADVATSGLAEELVVQAIEQAVERGLVAVDDMFDYANERGGRAKNLVNQYLEKRRA